LSVGEELEVRAVALLTCALFCRMDDRGEVKCIKFSLENKILAVQRTAKAVVRQSSEYCRQERGAWERLALRGQRYGAAESLQYILMT
jgi:hypothetical protein